MRYSLKLFITNVILSLSLYLSLSLSLSLPNTDAIVEARKFQLGCYKFISPNDFPLMDVLSGKHQQTLLGMTRLTRTETNRLYNNNCIILQDISLSVSSLFLSLSLSLSLQHTKSAIVEARIFKKKNANKHH